MVTLTEKFDLTVHDPCNLTVLDSTQSFTKINVIAGAGTSTVPFEAFTNSIASLRQNSTYCQSTIYSKQISSSENGTVLCYFNTASQATSFSLRACYLKEVGNYTITLTAYLSQYVAKTATVTF